tara:strand:- start:1069 stop:9459 length:8391 start_codon:yes stop_codon:yes gene_type:complete
MKGYKPDGSESLVLSSYLQSFVDQKVRPEKGAYRSYTYSDGRFSNYYDQELSPSLLPKGKAIEFSVSELLSPESSAYTDTGCSAFYLENTESQDEVNLGEIADSEEEVYHSPLVNIEFKNVKFIKNQTSKALFFDASIEGEQKNRSIVSVADATNITLPRRKLITKDFSFIIINASRGSIEINSPEGTGVMADISLASGKFIKIDYSSPSFTVGSQTDCTVLERGVYRTDLRALAVSRQTVGSSKLLINENNNNINIINNSGAQLNLRLKGTTNDESVQAGNYKHITTNTSVVKTTSNNNKQITVIRDGAVELSQSIYKQEAVIFNDNAIRGFNVSSFFESDFVPFISSEKIERPSVSSMSYKGFVIIKGNEAKSIAPLGPVSFRSDGSSYKAIDISCRLNEFKLSTANNKIILPNKRYDYIANSSDSIKLCLYNRFEDESNLYKLNSDGSFNYDSQEESYVSTELTGNNLHHISQSGGTINTEEKQTYIDLFEESWNDDIEDYKEVRVRRFYYSSFYNNEVVVFKDGFKVIGSTESDTCTFINVSDVDCIDDEGNGIGKNQYVTDGSFGYEVGDAYVPSYTLIPDSSKVYILTHKADVKLSDDQVDNISNLKIANISNGKINVKYSEEISTDDEDTTIEHNLPIYSCERADFSSTTDISYSEIRKERREDWIIRLVDLDIPHLIEDPEYFDEKEWQMERDKRAKGARINVNYIGERYKFSNIFNTNKIVPRELQTFYQTIEDYNDPYKFGVTFLSNKKGVKRDVFFNKNISDMAAPMYLKIPWDMKKDIIAYMLNTGHERITKCSHFNERTGEITLSGIEAIQAENKTRSKYYIIEGDENFSYDFTYDLNLPEDYMDTIEGPIQSAINSNADLTKINKAYGKKQKEEEVLLIYNNESYKAGEKIKAELGKKEYKLRMPYSINLKVSQFFSDSVDDSAENEESIVSQKRKFETDTNLKIEGEYTEKDEDGNDVLITSQVKSPAWTKVSQDNHKENFLNAMVEKVIPNNSTYELIQGRKIKDIQGEYKDGLIDKSNNAGQSYWKYNKNFVFSIPLLENASYSTTQVGDEEIEIDEENKEARIKIKLLKNNLSNIESPAYEYKVLSSLRFTNSTGSNLLRLSIEDKDSVPFSADGVIRSLNEDFSSPMSEEQSVKALDRLKQRTDAQLRNIPGREGREEQQEAIGDLEIARQTETNRRDFKRHLSLKNNNGLCFVPFSTGSSSDPMQNFIFNISRDKPSYKSLRIRLKKLTNKKIFFNDLTKDEKIGTYLTENPDRANLRYQFSSEIESISYHDIARPGGVAKLKTFNDLTEDGWSDVVTGSYDSTDYISLNDTDNGDAIVFENSSGGIVRGRVYFLRLVAVSKADSNGQRDGNLYSILNIFDKSSDQDLVNVVTSGFSSNRYKIVNYFELQAESGTGDHREETPIINKVYDQGIEETKYTSLNFPLIVNNKRFYLERPYYYDYSLVPAGNANYEEKDTSSSFSSYPNTIYDKKGGVFSVRANLELSAISEGLISNSYGSEGLESNEKDKEAVARSQFIDGEELTWHDLDIFASFKNLMFRNNTSIDLVSHTDNIVRIIVKLSKGKEYRYLLKNNNDRPNTKIFIEGTEINLNQDRQGYFVSKTGEIEIHYDYSGANDNVENIFSFSPEFNEFQVSEEKRNLVEELFKQVFITESAYYVDQVKKPEGSGDPVSVEYMDYQIPNLNNWNGDSENVMYSPSSFSYTEGLDRVFSFNQKYENLTESQSDHGLAYDGPLPATVKYIYPITAKNSLQFYVSPEYLKGFINGFESMKSDGSISYRNKPTSISFTLEKLDKTVAISDASYPKWDLVPNVELNVLVNNNSNLLSTSVAYASGENGNDLSDIYRLVINKEVFQYYKEGELKYFSNDNMRVPFNWSATILQSQIESDGLESEGVVSIGMTENHQLTNSISIPEDGFVKFGCHSYKKEHIQYGSNIPHERIYKYRLSHKLFANYTDKIALGGISKVLINSAGLNYRVPPEVVISDPSSESEAELKKTARAKAHIESGKIKHIEIVSPGAGYSVVGKASAQSKVINRRVDSVPEVLQPITIEHAIFSHSFATTNNSKVVTHDGQKNIVLGARVSGSGIQSDTKVEKINSSTEFEIDKAATSTASSVLTMDIREKQMPYISLSEHLGVETAEVSVNNNKEDLGECQESFGMLLAEAEQLAEDLGVDPENASEVQDFKSSLTRYVKIINAVSESDDWNNVKDINRKIKETEDEFNERLIENKDTQSYSITTEDEYQDLIGTESSQFLGLYQAEEEDEVQEISVTIKEDGECQEETFPEPTKPSLTAIINNNSIAEYRVVKNEVANKSQPWISSFSREQEPSLPKGFGINPGSPVTAEVFNSYARTVNNMRLIGAHVPVFAKVRKYRKYEYRYVEDMGGITFSNDDPKKAGESYAPSLGDQEALSYEFLSKQNYIDFYDHKEQVYKRAWFSGFKNDNKGDNTNIQKQWGSEKPFNIVDRTLTYKEEEYEFSNKGTDVDESYDPYDKGLPNDVNIPDENGVFCFPAIYDDLQGDYAGRLLSQGEGLELPELDRRRAFVFGGELVYSSEEYDVTDETINTETSIVNIAGSEVITASYENEIIFGCQVRNKPFWSTFLKTTIEWTEFEVVPSPSFLESAVGEDGLGELQNINGTVYITKGICENKKIGVADGQTFHSLCQDGRKDGTTSEHSYESYFGLVNGQDIIGPSMEEFEFYSREKINSNEGKQIFKIDPEFTQALAVYGSNKSHYIVRPSAGGTSNPNTWEGPCVHKCSPFGRKVFIISDEQLKFDLMKDG